MTFAHIILLLIGILMVLESAWAIGAPQQMREQLGRLIEDEAMETNPWPVFFAVSALVLWAIAVFGQTWAHRILFVIGVLALVLMRWSWRRPFLASWYALFIGRRTNMQVRLIYALELALALAFIQTAIQGW